MEDLEWGWSRDLSTGITVLDHEHRRLILCYRNLVRHVRDTADAAAFRDCFRTLKDQTADHFAHEERVMRNIGYPHFRAHKIAHDRVLADFDDFIVNIGTGFFDDDLQALAKHFKYWFSHHVRKHDVGLLGYIDRSG